MLDNGWEKYAASAVEVCSKVAAWGKNDHLGFHIRYLWSGPKRKYIADFLVRYASGKTLVLEIKGEPFNRGLAQLLAMIDHVTAGNS